MAANNLAAALLHQLEKDQALDHPQAVALTEQLKKEPCITSCFNCGATIDLNEPHDCWSCPGK